MADLDARLGRIEAVLAARRPPLKGEPTEAVLEEG
jgi:hypothetical protein